jgi:hypothetical protein
LERHSCKIKIVMIILQFYGKDDENDWNISGGRASHIHGQSPS